MSAEEMFKELDYKKREFTSDTVITYNKTIYQYTDRLSVTKTIRFMLDMKRIYVEFYDHNSCGISMELLQAINKQVEELGWK